MTAFKYLLVDTNLMSSKRILMEQYIEDLQNQLNEFKSIVEDINNAWDGQDALKYINAMRDGLGKELNNLCGILGVYNKYLESAAKVYDSTDNGFYDKSKNIENKEY